MRSLFALGIVVVSAICGQFVTAQPPERRDGPPAERRDGLRDALDTNGDRELDADEMKNATANLAKADRNGDGKIDHEEFRPPLPPIPRGEGGFRGLARVAQNAGRCVTARFAARAGHAPRAVRAPSGSSSGRWLSTPMATANSTAPRWRSLPAK